MSASPWTGPDVGAAVSAAPDRPAPDATRSSQGADGSMRRSLRPLPTPLRPLSIPDLLDGGFAILRRRPRDVLVLAAALVLPVEVVSAIALRSVLGDAGLADLGDPTTAIAEDGSIVGGDAVLASAVVGTISLTLLAGALAVLVDGWYRDRDVSAGAALVTALRRSPVLLAATVVVHVLEAIGLLALGVGAYVAMAACHVVAPVVAVEGLGPLGAVRRSASLARRRPGPALALPGLVALVGLLVGFGFQAIPEVAVAAVSDDWDWLVRASGQLASQLVVVPFTAGVAVLFHLDLRMRTEAHDLQLRADARPTR